MPTEHSPTSNQFRCESCGRYFNTKEELDRHAKECAAALQSGAGHRPIENPREEGEDRDWVSVP
jgi:hypothetical protein